LVAVLALCAALAGAVVALAAGPASAPLMTYITGLAQGSPYVWVSLTTGGSPTQLGPANSALISPSGAAVAAVSIEKQTNASTLSLYSTTASPGQPLTLIPKRPQFMQLLAWSPDSKLLLVTVGTSPAQLMIVDTTTHQYHELATGVIYGASFTPGSSDAIVYARSQPGKTAVNIYATNPAGTSTHELTRDGRSEYPLWCPSGIIYSHQTPRSKNPYPELQLWVMHGDGTGTRKLTSVAVQPQDEGLTPVACSSNGLHLLANYVGPPGSNATEAYAGDLGPHGKWRPVNSQGGYIGDAISKNGKTLLVTKGTASDLGALSIETYPWAGGKPTTIVGQGAYASWNG
jgi:WD40 repeat protein